LADIVKEIAKQAAGNPKKTGSIRAVVRLAVG
jgi:hypothetical protein